MAKNFPKDVQEALQPRLDEIDRQPKAPRVFGSILIIITFLLFVGVFIFGGVDGVHHDFTYSQYLLRFLIIAAYNTGCRIGELLGLKYSDFSIEDKTLKISRQVKDEEVITKSGMHRELKATPLKTKSSKRMLPLNMTMIKEYQRHKKWHAKEMQKNGYSTNYVFTTKTGNFYDRKNIRRALESFYSSIGIEPAEYNENGKPIFNGIHTYRHTFATQLAQNGVPIQTVSALLGHSDISMTTKYYINVAITDKMDAVLTLDKKQNRKKSVKTNEHE